MQKLMLMGVSVLALMGVQATDLYVSPTGSDEASGADVWHPMSIRAALEALAGDGGTIHAAKGTYALNTAESPFADTLEASGATCITLSAPIKIVGSTGNPADVIFTRASSLANARIFTLNHEGAVLKYLTVKDGVLSDTSPVRSGGNVFITEAGGSVEDCILTNGKAGNQNNTSRGGGNLAMLGGRCLRSVITGGKIGHYRPIGMNVLAKGDAVVENCLITRGSCSTAHEAAHDEGAVALLGTARLISCTVVDNKANRFSGVNILSTNARVINSLIYGNVVTYETVDRGNSTDKSSNGVSKDGENSACFLNCGTDVDTTKYPQLNATCFTVGSKDFIDVANGNWHLSSTSRALNAIEDYASSGATSTTDLDGNPRIQGGAVDAGCYESEARFAVVLSLVSDRVTFSKGVDIPFHATTAFAPSGDLTYVWDFGDGATVETSVPDVTHAYTTDGVFTVGVTVNGSDGTSATSQIVDAFEVMNLVFECTFEVSHIRGLVGGETATLTFTAHPVDAVGSVVYAWDFGDGTTEETSEESVTHTYEMAGQYHASVEARTETQGNVPYEFEDTITIGPKVLYVRRSGSTPTIPYDTYETAAQNPPAALTMAADGTEMRVYEGVYTLRGTETYITNSVHMVGMGATPEAVILQGYGTNNGKRNLRLDHEGALVENLTLEGGFADSATGGNLYLGSGVVSNCVLRNGRSNSSGGGGGGAFVKGGLLTHCVVTNSYLGNRGNGIVLQQTGGRVSNCLLGNNKMEWLGSRQAFSALNITGGVMDSCTIAGLSLLKYNPETALQMANKSDLAVNVGSNARVYNVTIADVKYYICQKFSFNNGTIITPEMVDACEDVPRRWEGAATSFVNCATDDATPINDTCFVGTLEPNSLFADYAAGDFTPGAVTKNKGAIVDGVDVPSVDLAGNSRVQQKAIDIGCYEVQPAKGLSVVIR